MQGHPSGCLLLFVLVTGVPAIGSAWWYSSGVGLTTPVFLFLVLVAGAAVALWSLSVLWHEVRSYGWREVPATIARSEVELVSEWQSADALNARPREHKVGKWCIEYRYRIYGLEWTSHQVRMTDISVGPLFMLRPHAARYPEGAVVTAYVSPEDPGLAVLERGISVASLAFLGFGLGAMAGSLWFLRGLRDKGRRLRQAPAARIRLSLMRRAMVLNAGSRRASSAPSPLARVAPSAFSMLAAYSGTSQGWRLVCQTSCGPPITARRSNTVRSGIGAPSSSGMM